MREIASVSRADLLQDIGGAVDDGFEQRHEQGVGALQVAIRLLRLARHGAETPGSE